MSKWITNLADKAENLLNQIDQNAATALQETNSINVVKNLTNSSTAVKATLSPSLPNTEKRPTNEVNLDAEELTAFKNALSEITAERDGLLKLQIDSTELEPVASVLQRRIKDLEDKINDAISERDDAFRQLNAAENRCMQDKCSLAQTEAILTQVRQEKASLEEKLQLQIMLAEHSRKELQEYRAKAQRALQAKDLFIAELKTKSSIGNDDESAVDISHELTDYQRLNQQLQNDLEELQQQLRDRQANETELVHELAVIHMKMDNMSTELHVLRERNVVLESEKRIHSQELSSLRQQLSNSMAAAATREQEQDQQIQQLKREQSKNLDLLNNIKAKDKYEQRLRALTQSLVERQYALETITAERNELKLQHERLQLEIQELIPESRDPEYQRRTMRNPLISNSTDDAKAQLPRLLYPNPFDNKVARRVKRAYTTLDSASIRFGAFLRRYPLMRIGLLLYVLILPIWVIFVLMSTMPT